VSPTNPSSSQTGGERAEGGTCALYLTHLWCQTETLLPPAILSPPTSRFRNRVRSFFDQGFDLHNGELSVRSQAQTCYRTSYYFFVTPLTFYFCLLGLMAFRELLRAPIITGTRAQVPVFGSWDVLLFSAVYRRSST